ncbi:hypothetical protein BaRGS_00037355, partial [Batillaria attramentaria]
MNTGGVKNQSCALVSENERQGKLTHEHYAQVITARKPSIVKPPSDSKVITAMFPSTTIGSRGGGLPTTPVSVSLPLYLHIQRTTKDVQLLVIRC